MMRNGRKKLQRKRRKVMMSCLLLALRRMSHESMVVQCQSLPVRELPQVAHVASLQSKAFELREAQGACLL